jgi:hypothetical protein
MREEAQRRLIRPVDIVDHQQQRSGHRQTSCELNQVTACDAGLAGRRVLACPQQRLEQVLREPEREAPLER